MKLKHKLMTVGLGMVIGVQANAVPWCHRGTIVTVANVNWSGATNVAMSSGIPVPPGHSDPERYQVFHSTHNFCSAYSGGGGPSWPWPVPGSGSVRTVTTGPFILTNTVNNYELNMGVSFSCDKCYSLPPYQQVHELQHARALPGTEGTEEYQKRVREE